MKQIKKSVLLLAALLIGFASSISYGSARLQVIHNAADPVASAVVLASGFVSKDANQGGANFELIGVLADGQVVYFPDPVITGIESEFTSEIPSTFELSQNYPNPFNPKTMISFSIPKDDIVTLRVFNALGQEVAVLIDQQELKAGRYSVDFDASRLYSGIYFYRIDSNSFQAVRKMTYLK